MHPSGAMERDILILGGGPSGFSTALHLNRIAPHLTGRILILEKEHYPRHKLCAGGLVIDAERILKRLGLDAGEVPHVDVKKIKFDFEGRGLRIRSAKGHALRVIRRNEFDAWLAGKTRAAGIEIREGTTVRNVFPGPNGVTVQTDQGDFRAQIAVGADGSNGVTRRCILPNEPVHTARALEVLTPAHPAPARRAEPGRAIPSSGRETAHPHCSRRSAAQAPGKCTPRNDMPRDGTASFDFFPVPQNIAGYVWDFPTQINGEPTRCRGIYDANILSDYSRPALKDPLAREMKRAGYDPGDYEIQGYPIRWYSPENKASVPRVLLVGDAVGADPIFGEGISIALGYGAVAAREISESFRRNDFSFRGYRARLARSGLGQTLFARWIITHIIYPLKWRWFQVLLWRLLKPIVFLIAWTLVLNWSKRLK